MAFATNERSTALARGRVALFSERLFLPPVDKRACSLLHPSRVPTQTQGKVVNRGFWGRLRLARWAREPTQPLVALPEKPKEKTPKNSRDQRYELGVVPCLTRKVADRSSRHGGCAEVCKLCVGPSSPMRWVVSGPPTNRNPREIDTLHG